MFGCALVIRMSRAFRDRAVIRENVVTKIGTALLALTCCAQSRFETRPLGMAIAASAVVFFGLVIFVYLERVAIAEFRARVPAMLDRWILNMRMGNSLSASRDAALREEDERFRNLMRPLFDTRAARRPEHLLLSASVRAELVNIDSSTPAPLARLESLRRSIRKASDFRRKSGQATRQTAIQACVMLVLLLAMAAYTVRRYGWARSGDLVTVSTLLSLIGVALMCQLAKKTRWKL